MWECMEMKRQIRRGYSGSQTHLYHGRWSDAGMDKERESRTGGERSGDGEVSQVEQKSATKLHSVSNRERGPRDVVLHFRSCSC